MTANEIAIFTEFVNKLESRQDFIRCFDILRDAERDMRDRAGYENVLKNSIRVGSAVSFVGRSGMLLTGTVTKMNRTTAKVAVASPGVAVPMTWSVSLNLLKPAASKE